MLEQLKLSSILDSITTERKPDAMPASHHLLNKNKNFNKHAKFILIDQISHIETDKE